jgi:adenosine deaminase
LASVPHSGELLGPPSIRTALGALHPDRLGHGVRSAEDPELLQRIVDAGVGLEVCPASNVALGVYPTLAEVPLRRLVGAGAQLALGADDPLLFGPRLAAQYQAARDVHGFSDPELAALARSSVEISRAPLDVRKRLLAGIDDWLAEGMDRDLAAAYP